MQSQTAWVNFLSNLIEEGHTRGRVGPLGDKAHRRGLFLPRTPPLLHGKKDQSKRKPTVTAVLSWFL